MPNLAGNISELETMHKVLEGEINVIVQPTLILSHTNEIEILELVDAKTNPPENLQDNGTTLTISTQTSPLHLPP